MELHVTRETRAGFLFTSQHVLRKKAVIPSFLLFTHASLLQVRRTSSIPCGLATTCTRHPSPVTTLRTISMFEIDIGETSIGSVKAALNNTGHLTLAVCRSFFQLAVQRPCFGGAVSRQSEGRVSMWERACALAVARRKWTWAGPGETNPGH